MAMIPIHVIAFFIAVMTVPEDVNQFTIGVQGKTIRWTQEETGWHAVELPRDDWGVYTVNGTQVTIAGEGRTMKTDVGRFLTVPEGVDWKTATQLSVAHESLGEPISIQRQDGKIILSQAKGALFGKPAAISWPVAKKEARHAVGMPEAVGELKHEPGAMVFEVKDGEATVNEILIKRFAVGGKTVTASYQNKSELKMRPRYTIELYNPYGMLLGEDTTGNTSGLFGDGPGYIEPGDVGSEELRIKWYPVDRILSKSAIPLPADWQNVKWIVLKDNNPRSLKAK
ncbi:MAG: hypothetical protein RRC34_04240 [Lentisphaeria bacterium]|nr:hypothetical protein [Lentisphaeria bacterium]